MRSYSKHLVAFAPVDKPKIAKVLPERGAALKAHRREVVDQRLPRSRADVHPTPAVDQIPRENTAVVTRAAAGVKALEF